MGEAENRRTAERVFRAINERDVSLAFTVLLLLRQLRKT